jgi:hypothetical protein
MSILSGVQDLSWTILSRVQDLSWTFSGVQDLSWIPTLGSVIPIPKNSK